MLFSRTVFSGALSFFVVLGCESSAYAAVHAGDQLQVIVYDHNELSGPLIVDDAGTISMPIAGTVRVSGLEPNQIARRIEVALKPYVIEPAVDVQLKSEFAAVFVSGGPGGVVKLEPGETLVTALTQIAAPAKPVSGSTASSAAAADDSLGDASALSTMSASAIDTSRVGLIRAGKGIGSFDVTALTDAGESGPVLQPGDTIVLVNKPLAVRVEGDVRTPGVAHLRVDEPLSDAIAQRGGLLPSAAVSHLELQRSGTDKLLALGDPILTKPAVDGDTLDVPYAPHVVLTGSIEKPGPVALKSNFTLLSALYAGGGPSKWADLKHVQVIDPAGKRTYDVSRLAYGDTTQNPELRDGDMVLVPEGHKVDAKGVFSTILGGASALLLFGIK